MKWWRIILTRRIAASVIVSVVTLVLIGGVIVTTTSLGCGPAKQLGIKPQRCLPSGNVVALLSPSPYQSPSPSNAPTPNPSSAPYPNPASGPYPNPASGPYPPTGGISSGPYPPLYPPTTAPFPAAITLNCRLPIYAGQSGSGGFIAFPGGSFIADPNSAVSVPSPNPGTPSPLPGYGQTGFYGLSYDRFFSRWLPVGPAWVAPDGKHYAYPSPDSIYVVDVASGTQVEIGIGHQWSVVGVQAAGVYATQQNQGGLWLWPFSGTLTQITTTGFWQAVSKDAAYGTATSAVPNGVPNNIIRFDLKTGSTSAWFTRTNAQSSVVGFDAQGNPIVFLSSQWGSEIWITTGAGSGSPIAGSPEGVNFAGPPVADDHGVWFQISFGYGNINAMALYVPGSGFYGMTNISGGLAGGCY